METSQTAKKKKRFTKRKLTTLNLTLISLVIAQLGIIVFLAKHSRFLHRPVRANAPLTPVLEIDLDEVVPKFAQEPVIDHGPAVLPVADSILVVYKPPQPSVPALDVLDVLDVQDVQMSPGEKEIVLDLSAPPAEFAKPAKKAKSKVAAKSQAKERKSRQAARQAVKKHEKHAKSARPQPKSERVKIVMLPPKRSAAKTSRTVASILPQAQESALDRAASMAADESYNENSARRDARRKEMARETERVKGVFQEE